MCRHRSSTYVHASNSAAICPNHDALRNDLPAQRCIHANLCQKAMATPMNASTPSPSPFKSAILLQSTELEKQIPKPTPYGKADRPNGDSLNFDGHVTQPQSHNHPKTPYTSPSPPSAHIPTAPPTSPSQTAASPASALQAHTPPPSRSATAGHAARPQPRARCVPARARVRRRGERRGRRWVCGGRGGRRGRWWPRIARWCIPGWGVWEVVCGGFWRVCGGEEGGL